MCDNDGDQRNRVGQLRKQKKQKTGEKEAPKNRTTAEKFDGPTLSTWLDFMLLLFCSRLM